MLVSMNGTDLSKSLRSARQKAGLTIERAAVECGCSVRTVTRAESGANTPRLPLIREMARVYGVSFDDLIHEDHSDTPAPAGVKPGDDPTPAKKRVVAKTQGA